MSEFALFERLAQAILIPSLYCVAKLGIADLLKDGPQSIAVLAEKSGTHSPTLYRVMRALSSEGIFEELPDQVFKQNQVSALLSETHPSSVRHLTILVGEPWHWHLWGNLLPTLKTGKPAFEEIYGKQMFEYFAQHPDVGRAFEAAMNSFSDAASREVLGAFDFGCCQTVVDVGGNHGALLNAILSAHPHVQGVLFDHPSVVDRAQSSGSLRNIENRLRYVAGDFFESIPEGGDTYLLKNILHDWDDARAIQILSNCKRAMSRGARILVIERPVEGMNARCDAKTYDLEMLLLTPGGKERTLSEYRALFQEAGLTLSQVCSTPSSRRILIGTENTP